MTFPINDWQFWAATAAGLLAAWWLTKGLIPWGRLIGRKGSARGRRARKVVLTISAKPIGSAPNSAVQVDVEPERRADEAERSA